MAKSKIFDEICIFDEEEMAKSSGAYLLTVMWIAYTCSKGNFRKEIEKAWNILVKHGKDVRKI